MGQKRELQVERTGGAKLLRLQTPLGLGHGKAWPGENHLRWTVAKRFPGAQVDDDLWAAKPGYEHIMDGLLSKFEVKAIH